MTYKYEKDLPYMSGYEYFASFDEAATHAGKFASRYSNAECVYKVVGVVSPVENPTPQYTITLV